MSRKKYVALFAVIALVALVTTAFSAPTAGRRPVRVKVFAPEKGHVVGVEGRGWIVDLEAKFRGVDLAATGGQLELTGPGDHQTAPPFPSPFSPGKDDAFPGLIVVMPTTTIGAGPGQNLAGLFNLVGVTDRDDDETEIWATWIVGAPLFGVDTDTAIFVAVADDLDGNGIYDDAPDVVPDVNGDGRINRLDLRAYGVASNIVKVKFHITGAP